MPRNAAVAGMPSVRELPAPATVWMEPVEISVCVGVGEGLADAVVEVECEGISSKETY